MPQRPGVADTLRRRVRKGRTPGAGSAGELLLDMANGNIGDGLKNVSFKLIGKGTEKFSNKFLPGYGKKFGEEGFNLGTEILDLGRKLKLSGVERVSDKVEDEKDDDNNRLK